MRYLRKGLLMGVFITSVGPGTLAERQQARREAGMQRHREQELEPLKHYLCLDQSPEHDNN